MTVADKQVVHESDLQRLLDAGYEVTFKLPPSSLGYPDAGCYWVEITAPSGSTWRVVDASPAAALHSIWPLSGGPNGGGCGHCDGMGCTRPDCMTCACWLGGHAVSGACGVCGYTDPDAIGDEGDQDEAEGDDL